ncbi:MAG TPA: DMT family transporter [Acidimicrobiia bacterium]
MIPPAPEAVPANLGEAQRPPWLLPLLAVMILALGFNWPLISLGVDAIDPVWLGALRVLVAAVLSLFFGVATGRLGRPHRGDSSIILGVAVFRIALTIAIVFTAVQFVPAGRSSVLVWTASLWTVPMAAIFVGERMTPLRWLGLAIGIAGIVSIVEPWRLDWTDGGVVVGHAMLLFVALFTAGVTVQLRGHQWATTPLDVLPHQLGLAAALLVGCALAVHGFPHIDWTWGLGLNVLYQGAAASMFATWAQSTVLRHYPAISTQLAMMAVPVVGLFSSVAILDEALTLAAVVGVACIVAGVALGLWDGE